MPISGQHLYCSVHTTEAIAAPGLVWTTGAGADSRDTYTTGARVAPTLSTLQKSVLHNDVSSPQGLEPHLDMSTIQRPLQHLDVSIPKGPKLYLDLSGQQKPLLRLDLSRLQRPVLNSDLSSL
jgi:hypothetical protein